MERHVPHYNCLCHSAEGGHIDYLRKSVRERPLAELAVTESEIDALFDASDDDHWKTPPADWVNPTQALE